VSHSADNHVEDYNKVAEKFDGMSHSGELIPTELELADVQQQ
jgi:hypothetical protein